MKLKPQFKNKGNRVFLYYDFCFPCKCLLKKCKLKSWLAHILLLFPRLRFGLELYLLFSYSSLRNVWDKNPLCLTVPLICHTF